MAHSSDCSKARRPSIFQFPTWVLWAWGILFILICSGALVAWYHSPDWDQIDEDLTTRRGAELCQANGYAEGPVEFGKGHPVNGGGRAHSTIECNSSQEGVRVFLEFDSVKRK